MPETHSGCRRIDASAAPAFMSQVSENPSNRSNNEHPDLARNIALSTMIPLRPVEDNWTDHRAENAESDEPQDHVETTKSDTTGE